jgi:hypothetical protein
MLVAKEGWLLEREEYRTLLRSEAERQNVDGGSLTAINGFGTFSVVAEFNLSTVRSSGHPRGIKPAQVWELIALLECNALTMNSAIALVTSHNIVRSKSFLECKILFKNKNKSIVGLHHHKWIEPHRLTGC